MTNILHITSSIRGDDSVSTSLGNKLLEKLAGKNVVTRDLAKNDLPFIVAERQRPPSLRRRSGAHGL